MVDLRETENDNYSLNYFVKYYCSKNSIQDTLAKRLTYGRIFNYQFVANLLLSVSAKEFFENWYIYTSLFALIGSSRE